MAAVVTPEVAWEAAATSVAAEVGFTAVVAPSAAMVVARLAAADTARADLIPVDMGGVVLTAVGLLPAE